MTFFASFRCRPCGIYEFSRTIKFPGWEDMFPLLNRLYRIRSPPKWNSMIARAIKVDYIQVYFLFPQSNTRSGWYPVFVVTIRNIVVVWLKYGPNNIIANRFQNKWPQNGESDGMKDCLPLAKHFNHLIASLDHVLPAKYIQTRLNAYLIVYHPSCLPHLINMA